MVPETPAYTTDHHAGVVNSSSTPAWWSMVPELPANTATLITDEALVLLSLSTVLVVPVILANVCLKKRRNSPSIYSALFLSTSLLFSCTMLATNRRIAALLHYNDSVNKMMTHATTPGCWVQGIFVQFSATSMMTTWLIVAYVLNQIVAQRKTMSEGMSYKWHLAFGWWLIPSLTLTVVPFLFRPPEWQRNLDFCWLNEDHIWYQLLSFHGWMFVITLLGARNIFPVLRTLRNHWRYGEHNNTRSATRDYIVRHTLFIMFFSIVFVLVTQYTFTLWLMRAAVVVHEQYYAISAQLTNVAYSSIGTLGFVVFGTANNLVDNVFSCCSSCFGKSNARSDFRYLHGPSFSEPLVNESREVEEEESNASDRRYLHRPSYSEPLVNESKEVEAEEVKLA